MIKENMFKDKLFMSKLWTLTLPLAVQSLLSASVAAADALMLGNLDQNSMSAVSLATQIQFIQFMLLYSFTGAAVVLGAQYWGKKDIKSIDSVFGVAIRLSIAISIITFVGCVFFPRYLMLVYTNEEVLIEIGIKYLKIAGWSYLVTGISQCYLNLMKISDHTNKCALISGSAVVINIVLNAFFIFGLVGFDKMGAEGAALATLISRIIELVWAVGCSYKKDYLRPTFYGLLHRDVLICTDYYKIMGPLLGASIVWACGFSSYSAFMGHLGTDAAAANSVSAVIRDLLCCLCNGLCVGGGIIIGNELGAGRLDTGKLYGERLFKMSFIIGFACTLIMIALIPLIMNFVKLTDEASYLLRGMMLIMALYMIGRCVNTITINGIFDSGGDTIFDLYSLIVTMWCVAVPLAALGTFVFHWNPLVVYACTCLDEVGKIPWVYIRFKKYIWVKDLTR